MGYVAILLGTLAAFIWFTPARDAVGEAAIRGTQALYGSISTPDSALRVKADELYDSARAKAMELIRGQIHEAVDDMVK